MKETSQKVAMEFSSFFLHLLFFSLIFQLSNTIVSSAEVEIPARNAPTDKLGSLTEQMDEKNADIGKRLVQQRMKRDTDDDTDDDSDDETGDMVYIDHRYSNCLSDPRYQGECFASYAFATIAFYEWLHCKRTGLFRAFSEQYVIDCSHRQGNIGCRGGTPLGAIMFIDKCGLALRENYPYLGWIGICPYPETTPYENMGSLRFNDYKSKFIPLEKIEEYLQFSPIIVVVEINYNFLAYSGGVDDNEGHTHDLLHAMLLIGHGRENGEDYWLFKTSYFNPSLSDGYYKLNKYVQCFDSGIGVRGPIPGPN